MNIEKIVKEARLIMIICLVLGILLISAGIILDALNVGLIPNKKALVGLSFIPLSIAFVNFLKLMKIKKSPQKMKKTIILESDERIVSMKNDADAKAFKILQGAIFLGYMGYTLMIPEDVFESVGWWMLLAILFVSLIAQGVMHFVVNSEKHTGADEM